MELFFVNMLNAFSATTFVTEIVNAIKGMLTGLGDSFVTFFDSVFTTTEGNLTTLGIVVLAMVGVGLGIMFVKMLMNKIRG